MRKRYLSPRKRRAMRIRAKIQGTSRRPRLSVYRSSQAIYAQIIDDGKGTTLLAVSEKELNPSRREKPKKGKTSVKPKATPMVKSETPSSKPTKTQKAKMLGELMAKKAAEKGIKEVVFDRGPYQYHGRIKEFAQSLRIHGLKF